MTQALTRRAETALAAAAVTSAIRPCLARMPRQWPWHPRLARQGGGAKAQRAASSADNAAGRDAGPRSPRQLSESWSDLQPLVEPPDCEHPADHTEHDEVRPVDEPRPDPQLVEHEHPGEVDAVPQRRQPRQP